MPNKNTGYRFVIGNKILSEKNRPFILAEMACAHDGQIELAIEMVNGAADAGADGIQFQLFTTRNLLTPNHKFYNIVRSLEIPYVEWKDVFCIARKRGLKIFVNPLTTDAFDIIKMYGADALKIHSADLSNPDMLKNLTDFRLPVLLSTGGSTEDEVEDAIKLLKSERIENIILMHGFQAYPTSLQDTNLNYINRLKKVFGLLVGYQDHVDGNSELATIIPLLAMAKGAVLLEKHITDDRSRKGTDYESALEGHELKLFVDVVKKSWASFGQSKVRALSKAEHIYRKNFKKTIVAANEINIGDTINESLLLFMRGEQGHSPLELNKLVGKRCIKKIKKYETIKIEYLKPLK